VKASVGTYGFESPILRRKDGDMAQNKVNKLKVTLALKWIHGDEYEAAVSVELTDTCYHEGKLVAGLPPGTLGIPEIEYLTYSFTHDENKKCGALDHTVQQTIRIKSSSGKRSVTAYATVNGEIAGEATAIFPRAK
jgi:hypothetical protein